MNSFYCSGVKNFLCTDSINIIDQEAKLLHFKVDIKRSNIGSYYQWNYTTKLLPKFNILYWFNKALKTHTLLICRIFVFMKWRLLMSIYEIFSVITHMETHENLLTWLSEVQKHLKLHKHICSLLVSCYISWHCVIAIYTGCVAGHHPSHPPSLFTLCLCLTHTQEIVRNCGVLSEPLEEVFICEWMKKWTGW